LGKKLGRREALEAFGYKIKRIIIVVGAE